MRIRAPLWALIALSLSTTGVVACQTLAYADRNLIPGSSGGGGQGGQGGSGGEGGSGGGQGGEGGSGSS